MTLTSRALASFRYRTARVRQFLDARRLTGEPVPPAHLQARVVGGFFPDFVSSGFRIAREVLTLVPDAKGRVLDFGCGCGRVTTAFARLLPGSEVHGSDIDLEAVGWCRTHRPSARYSVNTHAPPTRYPACFFDLVVAVSVFTHLPEDLQFAWLAELRRITRPGRRLVLTVHGPAFYDRIPVGDLDNFLARGFYYLKVPRTEGLPGFYRAAFHTHDYLREKWGNYFQIERVCERAVAGQDAAVCRRTDTLPL